MQGAPPAGAAAGAVPWLARANPVWGDLPPGALTTSPDICMMHVHLLGGVAPYESLYYRDAAGVRTRGFDAEFASLIWNGACVGAPNGLELSPAVFGNDGAGKPIHLGPLAKPLWNRPDIRDRLRVIVQSHNLMPHEAAIPLALTGLRLGNPNLASLGTAIAHRYLALDEDAGLPPRSLPYAYALIDERVVFQDLLVANLGAVGQHPGSARPLVLKIGPGFSDLLNQLQRTNMNSVKDALLDQYRAQYRDQLRHDSNLTRSNAFRDYDTSATALLNAASMSSLLSAVDASIPSNTECAREPAEVFEDQENPTRTAISAAAFLLTRPPETRARYVAVIDGGIEPRGGLPYDVHSFGHAGDTGSNLFNVFQALADVINDPSGTPDPNKLNLDNTLILITTEFGRTPFKSSGNFPNPGSMGRDHYPHGYVALFGGGPITNPGVAGSISDAPEFSAVADIPFSPTDVIATAMYAMGLSPFEQENLAVGQLTGSLQAINHLGTLHNLESVLLGL